MKTAGIALFLVLLPLVVRVESLEIRDTSNFYEEITIKGEFIGNITNTSNKTFISGTFYGRTDLTVFDKFIGTINGSMEALKKENMSIEGLFTGHMDGRWYIFNPYLSLTLSIIYIITCLIFIVSILIITSDFKTQICRLLLLLSFGVSISYGNELLFLDFYKSIPSTKIHPFIAMIGMAVVLTIVLIITYFILFFYSKLKSDKKIFLFLWKPVSILVPIFLVGLYTVIAIENLSILLLFGFVFSIVFRVWVAIYFILILLILWSVLFFFIGEHLQKRYLKDTILKALLKAEKKHLRPRFMKTIKRFFFLPLIASLPMLIVLMEILPEGVLITIYLFLSITVIVIFTLYLFYQSFVFEIGFAKKISMKPIILFKKTFKHSTQSFTLFVFFLLSIPFLIYPLQLIFYILTYTNVYGLNYPVLNFDPLRMMIVIIEVPAILLVSIYVFLIPYLYRIGVKPIQIGIICFLSQWFINETLSFLIPFLVHNITIFLLNSFLIAIIAYLIGTKIEKLIERRLKT